MTGGERMKPGVLTSVALTVSRVRMFGTAYIRVPFNLTSLVGIGTALADDPQLTARVEGVSRQPRRVVFDSEATDVGVTTTRGPDTNGVYHSTVPNGTALLVYRSPEYVSTDSDPPEVKNARSKPAGARSAITWPG